MAFDKLVGHLEQRQRLMAALEEDRLAHGYLFCGPQGVGAEAMAIELACGLNCEHGPGEPCGTCRHCLRIGNLQHPDVFLVIPSSSSAPPVKVPKTDSSSSVNKNIRERRKEGLMYLLAEDPYAAPLYNKNDLISVDDIRALRRTALSKPHEARKKIAIIVDADRMNTPAANALLKTLEEPPGNLMLILTTIRWSGLPATVISRCQTIHFSRLSYIELNTILMDRYDVNAANASELSKMSEGQVSEALTNMSETGVQLQEDALALLKTIHQASPFELFEKVESLTVKHREEPVLDKIFDHLLRLYREMFIHSAMDSSPSNLFGDRFELIKKLASTTAMEEIEKGIKHSEEAKQSIVMNANAQLTLLVLVLRLRLKQAAPGRTNLFSNTVPTRD